MNKTNIEWVKNPDGSQGYTWNPITGCLNDCPYCYARKLANGRLKSRYLANKNIAPFQFEDGNLSLVRMDVEAIRHNPFYPRFWPDRLLASFNHDVIAGKEKGIFACDMGELFGNWIPGKWQDEVFRVIELFPEHRFYLLTKQPQNLIKWSPFPDNCWVGVSATNKTQLTLAQHYLSEVEARIKYISFEPLLEQMTKTRIHFKGLGFRIDWIIIGAQTKPTKFPEISWVEEIVRAADAAGIPVFQKDNLKPILGDTLRQELPE